MEVKDFMRVLMVGRKPSIALEELRKYWGEIDVATGFFIPEPKGYDLVIAQEPTMKIGLPALLQAKLSRTTFICEVHGDYLERDFLPRKDLMAAKIVLKSSDFVRAVNNHIAESLRSWGVKHVMTIPSIYIRLDKFKPLIAHEDRENVVLSASRLVPEKGLELLIDAVPALFRNFPDLEVRIIGEGPERPRLEQQVRKLGVERVVRFLGWVSQDELVRQYNQAAVFVCTSLHEGGPRTVFEAAACHTPFVSTSVGIVREIFEHGREGYFIRGRDVRSLTEHVTKLLESPSLREEMGTRAREVVAKNFEWHRAIERYASAYIDIVASRRG